ncbi:DUF1826 domain-containing protein [Tanticharoenia sakaeratensis]|nr:DUF1826 domain-containing protein [Tanticharoenia sakaeratensis]
MPNVTPSDACLTRRELQLLVDCQPVRAPGHAMAMSRRVLPDRLRQAAHRHLATGPRLIVARGTFASIDTAVRQAFTAETQMLLEEMRILAQTFQSISGHDALRVRLERVVSDSCRKFHVDCVDLRLLCTYCGSGVQWTRDEGRTIAEAEPGAVVFLKGRCAPNWREDDTLRHRSPPISVLPEGDRMRLLLTVDAADACGASADEPLVIAA